MNRTARALPLFALLLVACGDRVSLGNDHGNLGGADADAAADTDTQTIEASVDGAASDVPWPGQGFALDGGVDYPQAGEFNEIVWSRWWPCATGTCAQQMWINADCQVFFNDRDKPPAGAAGTMDAADCAAMKAAAVTTDLAGALATAEATCAGSAVGGELIEYHTGGPTTGPWTQGRTERCPTAGAVGMVRKYVVIGTHAIPGATEQDPNLPQ